MSTWQINLAGMFGLTAAVAGAIALFQNVGLYWLLILASTIACLRAPIWPGANPILIAVAYMLLALVFNCTLSYYMKVAPAYTIVACFILPAAIYIVSFLKGMEYA